MRRSLNKGFGILEVVVGITLLGLAMFGFTKFMGTAVKGQTRVSGSLEFTTVMQSLLVGLRSQEACVRAFLQADGVTPALLPTTTTPAAPAPVAIIQLNSTAPGGGIRILQVGQQLTNAGGMTIVRIEFNQITTLGTTTTLDRYLANLHIESTKGNDPSLNNTGNVHYNVLVQILVDRITRQIDRCEPVNPPNPSDTWAAAMGDDVDVWTCVTDVDLTNLCSGEFGCTIKIRMWRKNYYDYPYYTQTVMLLEQPGPLPPSDIFRQSQADYAGITGSTQGGYNSSGHWFRIDVSPTHRVSPWSPWNLFYVYNYNHRYCGSSPQTSSPFHTSGTIPSHGPALPRYHFTFMMHPRMKGKVTVTKNNF